ncbi:hypothetical protein PVAND_002471 [Polypedilum vanderplanki]|uniref:Signal recognition particle receptor subunit beta n=1 Tax=Polypedilum vanderplanki TaxID=319348 RepID=A0A9J6BR37_POLVA|nr:hypothetical protein PVAND_002471 [Polypedilum vanderplanki]
MDKETRKEPIRLSEINFTPILIAFAVVFLTLVIIYLIKKRSPRRTDILLAGLCDSGKTLLYSLLLNGNEVETFTSLKENCGIFQIEDSKSLRIVDLPGHERLRLRLLENYKNSTKAIIYVVDSTTVQKEIRDVADFLYTLLADKALSSLNVLILCNKQDETMAKGKQVVEQLLEKEINVIRKTRTSQLQSVDNSSDKTMYLGKSDKDFDFSQISQKISFAESSAKNKDIEQIISFIKAL